MTSNVWRLMSCFFLIGALLAACGAGELDRAGTNAALDSTGSAVSSDLSASPRHCTFRGVEEAPDALISAARAGCALGTMAGIDNRGRYSNLDPVAVCDSFAAASDSARLGATERRDATELLVAYFEQGEQHSPAADPITDRTASEAVGIVLAADFRDRYAEIDRERFCVGFEQGFTDESLTPAEANEAGELLSQYYYERLDERPAAAENEGRTYREENAARANVISTVSGLQYEVITAGSSESPSPLGSDIVEVDLRGMNLQGRTFQEADGFVARLGGDDLPAGLQEGVQLMSAGAEFRFVLPPDLAFGEAGRGEAVPAGSTVVYEVRLVGVVATVDLLVKYTPGAADQARATIEEKGGTIVEELPQLDVVNALFDTAADMTEVIAELEIDASIVYVEPNGTGGGS